MGPSLLHGTIFTHKRSERTFTSTGYIALSKLSLKILSRNRDGETKKNGPWVNLLTLEVVVRTRSFVGTITFGECFLPPRLSVFLVLKDYAQDPSDIRLKGIFVLLRYSKIQKSQRKNPKDYIHRLEIGLIMYFIP